MKKSDYIQRLLRMVEAKAEQLTVKELQKLIKKHK